MGRGRKFWEILFPFGSNPPTLHLRGPMRSPSYYIRWTLKLEGETENMGVCTKERKGVTAAVLDDVYVLWPLPH